MSDGMDAQTHLMEVPPGVICMWNGSQASIPDGWVWCDGTNGTPDLRNRFIQGMQNSGNFGEIGGDHNHSHTGGTDGHMHNISRGSGDVYSGSSSDVDDYTQSADDTFTTDAADGRPYYYVLAYIMKL